MKIIFKYLISVIFLFRISLGSNISCNLTDFLYYKKIHIPYIEKLTTKNFLYRIQSTPETIESYLDICLKNQEDILKKCNNLSKDSEYFYVEKRKEDKGCFGIEYKKIKDIQYEKDRDSFTLIFEINSKDYILSFNHENESTDKEKADLYEEKESEIEIYIFKTESSKGEIKIEEGFIWNRKDFYIWLVVGIIKVSLYAFFMVPFKLGESYSFNGRFKPLDFMINYLFCFYSIELIYQIFGIFEPLFCSIVIFLTPTVYGLFTSYSKWATRKFFICIFYFI